MAALPRQPDGLHPAEDLLDELALLLSDGSPGCGVVRWSIRGVDPRGPYDLTIREFVGWCCCDPALLFRVQIELILFVGMFLLSVASVSLLAVVADSARVVASLLGKTLERDRNVLAGTAAFLVIVGSVVRILVS